MKLIDFDYLLPQKLIAQKPIRPRDRSKLMILNLKTHEIKHDFFFNLGNYLQPNDILVANNSKVIPARLIGQKINFEKNKNIGGGKIEILLLKSLLNGNWEIMVKGKIIPLTKIFLNKKLQGVILKKLSDQTWEIKFNLENDLLFKEIYKIGKAPTPPYIKKNSNLKKYQTIYAKKSGSVAAPTAGFHFTKRLMKKIKSQGINFNFITLHVGLGTFQPVRTEQIEEHQIHAEWGEISKATARKLNQEKENGQRIIAVGTTTTRTLEDFYQNNKIESGQKWVKNFIYPGYKFKFINGLITNFHIPKSSLLMLVSAFAGREFIIKAYQEAIEKKYRFYSFGDAMLII